MNSRAEILSLNPRCEWCFGDAPMSVDNVVTLRHGALVQQMVLCATCAEHVGNSLPASTVVVDVAQMERAQIELDEAVKIRTELQLRKVTGRREAGRKVKAVKKAAHEARSATLPRPKVPQ